MALVRRLINVKFQLAAGSPGFQETGQNTVTVTGLRVSCDCIKVGMPSGGTLQMSIYGMTRSVMNKLMTLGQVYQEIPRNTVTVTAGDEGGPMSTVFYGTVQQAWGDFASAPDVPFHIEGMTLGAESVIAAAPASYENGALAADLMKTIAQQMGCSFENTGVTAKLPPTYLYGSLRSQADDIAKAGNFKWMVDNNVLAIWPNGKARGDAVPKIGPASGMVGYPAFAAQQIIVTTLYNPSLLAGGKFTVESVLTPANKVWGISKLDYHLDSNIPKGRWYSTVQGFNLNYPAPIVH